MSSSQLNPPFDPGLHAEVRAAQAAAGGVPLAEDGLTHAPANDGILTPKCGQPSSTQLSLNWRLVNCPACRA